MAAGPAADPGARWPQSCAAASGTPYALARGHRGPGNGIKQRETDGDSVTGRGNKEGIESRQERAFLDGVKIIYRGGGEDQPPWPPAPAPALPRPRAHPPLWVPRALGRGGGAPTRVEVREGQRWRSELTLTRHAGPPFASPTKTQPPPPPRSGGVGRRSVGGNPPGKILGSGGGRVGGGGRETETLQAKSCTQVWVHRCRKLLCREVAPGGGGARAARSWRPLAASPRRF